MSLLKLLSSNGSICRSLTECLCMTGDSKVLWHGSRLMLMLLRQGLLNCMSVFPKSKSKYGFVGNIHERHHANSSYFIKFVADSDILIQPHCYRSPWIISLTCLYQWFAIRTVTSYYIFIFFLFCRRHKPMPLISNDSLKREQALTRFKRFPRNMGMDIFSSNLLQTIPIWQSAATNHYTVSESCCLLRSCVETLLKPRDLTINVVFLSAAIKAVTTIQSINKQATWKRLNLLKVSGTRPKSRRFSTLFYTFYSFLNAF